MCSNVLTSLFHYHIVTPTAIMCISLIIPQTQPINTVYTHNIIDIVILNILMRDMHFIKSLVSKNMLYTCLCMLMQVLLCKQTVSIHIWFFMHVHNIVCIAHRWDVKNEVSVNTIYSIYTVDAVSYAVYTFMILSFA